MAIINFDKTHSARRTAGCEASADVHGRTCVDVHGILMCEACRVFAFSFCQYERKFSETNKKRMFVQKALTGHQNNRSVKREQKRNAKCCESNLRQELFYMCQVFDITLFRVLEESSVFLLLSVF